MKLYQSRTTKFSGSDYHEVYKQALSYWKKLKSQTKRLPYVRSSFFGKDKVFLNLFWDHLQKKNWRDRVRRLKYLPCAIELIRKSTFGPRSKENPNKTSEILHRFGGMTKENDLFFVQIKEDKKSDKKYLISIFPENS